MTRARSLQRILKVQEELQRAAEVRLVALQQRAQSLEVMEGQILDSMTKGDPRDHGLASMASDRLRWLDRDWKENDAARSQCESHLREIAVRKLTCARAVKRVQQEDAVMAERRSGLDVLDAFFAARTSFK